MYPSLNSKGSNGAEILMITSIVEFIAFKWIQNDNSESRALLLSYIHTDATVKTCLIPLQGLLGMSKGSLLVSHIYVCTGAAVDAVLTASFTRTISCTIDI